MSNLVWACATVMYKDEARGEEEVFQWLFHSYGGGFVLKVAIEGEPQVMVKEMPYLLVVCWLYAGYMLVISCYTSMVFLLISHCFSSRGSHAHRCQQRSLARGGVRDAGQFCHSSC